MFLSIKDRPYCFYLDSSLADARFGRASFLGCDPFLIFSSKKDRIRIEHSTGKIEKFTADPFSAIRGLLDKYKNKTGKKGLQFNGGAVGYFGYDLKDFVEKLPDAAQNDLGLPDCMLAFYDSVTVYEHTAGAPGSGEKYSDRSFAANVVSNFTKDAYISAVLKAKEYIRRGDIYQVNLSQRFASDIDIDASELYMRLRSVSPAPFSSYLKFNDLVIASSSPERFLLKRGAYIETRPIKGTRPRGRNPREDKLLADELIRSPKDRAEHIMIVDLERNDLGRICEYGSVSPTEQFALESYANVHHLVSTVSGKLKAGLSPVDCLKAAFPGGSITGAPKIRSMEIIEELEPVKRSVYTGAIGYISFDGEMDTSIAIRTFVVNGNRAYFQVGGGIVADSDPQQEYEETLHKARGMFEALGVGSSESGVGNYA
jgi:para-aminobenzoate synthetase component 1